MYQCKVNKIDVYDSIRMEIEEEIESLYVLDSESINKLNL